MTDHKEFSHNGVDQIYHQKTKNSMKFAMLVVSEFFDTPNPEVTRLLQHVVDNLNEPDPVQPDASKLLWHTPENLRWLADQPSRPDRVPCGELTGKFLKEVADRMERLLAASNLPSTLTTLDGERFAVLMADLALMPMTSKATEWITIGKPIPEDMLMVKADREDLVTKLLRYDPFAAGIHGITWSGGDRAVVRYFIDTEGTGEKRRHGYLVRDLLTFVWRAGDGL